MRVWQTDRRTGVTWPRTDGRTDGHLTTAVLALTHSVARQNIRLPN